MHSSHSYLPFPFASTVSGLMPSASGYGSCHGKTAPVSWLQCSSPAWPSSASEKRTITAATTCHTCKLLESWHFCCCLCLWLCLCCCCCCWQSAPPPMLPARLLVLMFSLLCPMHMPLYCLWCHCCHLLSESIAIHSLVTMIKHKKGTADILLMRR